MLPVCIHWKFAVFIFKYNGHSEFTTGQNFAIIFFRVIWGLARDVRLEKGRISSHKASYIHIKSIMDAYKFRKLCWLFDRHQ